MGHNNTTRQQWESLERSQQQSLLAAMSGEHRETLTASGEEVIFEEDEVILRIGEPSQHFYLLTSGSVSVDVVARHYRARVQALGRGQVFGWSSLLDCCDTLFEVRALERTTALRFQGSALNAMCRQNPAFGVELLRWVLHSVAGRVLGAETKLAEFCGVSDRRA
jgi:CRP/FNR family transcriptional regulator, cyclic AMP receptor protein